MSHCFTSVQADLQFIWSSRHCVLVCKLYKFYVSCTVSSLANKNMYLKIDGKVQKEKDLQSGSAIWNHMSFPPQISLFPTHLVDVQSQSLVSLVQKGLFVPIVKEFFFLMVLPQESLIYFRVPPVLLFREMLGRIVFCRASGGRWALTVVRGCCQTQVLGCCLSFPQPWSTWQRQPCRDWHVSLPCCLSKVWNSLLLALESAYRELESWRGRHTASFRDPEN